MNPARFMKWFATRGRRSLLARILRANILVAAVSVISLTALFLFSYRAEFERQQLLRALMLAQFVARQSEVSALIGDRGAVEKIASSALGGEDVLAVRIKLRDNAHEVLASRKDPKDESNSFGVTGKSWVEAGEEIRPVQSGLLDWDDAAARQPESLGHVQLRISLRKEQALFLRTVEQSLVVMGGLLFLIAGVQFFRMRTLLRPLGSLVSFTKRVGTGDLLARSPVDQVDEIADVAVAFNTCAFT